MEDRKALSMMTASLLIVGTIGLLRRYIPLSSAMLAFLRGVIGAVSLVVFSLAARKNITSRVTARKLVLMILTGAAVGINWMLLFQAYNYTTIAKATLAYYMQPTIIVLVSPLVFKERLTVRKAICAAVALFGMVLVSGVLDPNEAGSGELTGILYGLGAAGFYSLVIILNKQVDDVDPFQKTIIQLSAAAAVLLPYLLAKHEFTTQELAANTAVLVLIAGVVHTGLAYILYFTSMNRLKAQTVSFLSYIDPVTAMLVSALVLHEGMTTGSLIGAVLIIGSAAAIVLH